MDLEVLMNRPVHILMYPWVEGVVIPASEKRSGEAVWKGSTVEG